MNKIIKFSALIVFLLLIVSCANNTNEVVDCTTVTGASFTSNGGQMNAMIQSQCGGSSCHSAGGREANKFLVTSDYTAILPSLQRATTTVLNGSMPEGSKLSSSELDKWQCWKESGFIK